MLFLNGPEPMFYYYLFGSPYSGMSTIVQQCAQAGIRGSELGKLPVLYPPIETQREIARLLSAYDDLIENNRRRMALLEQAAQLLYEEWFVRFRFPATSARASSMAFRKAGSGSSSETCLH